MLYFNDIRFKTRAIWVDSSKIHVNAFRKKKLKGKCIGKSHNVHELTTTFQIQSRRSLTSIIV